VEFRKYPYLSHERGFLKTPDYTPPLWKFPFTWISNPFTVLEKSAHPLTNAIVKSIGRVQITDHSPIWRVQFSFLGNYYYDDLPIIHNIVGVFHSTKNSGDCKEAI